MIKVSIKCSGITGCFCPRTSEYRNNVSIYQGKSEDEVIEQKKFMDGSLETRTLTPEDWGFTFYRNILEGNQE